MQTLYVGKTYSSWNAFQDDFTIYQNAVRQDFSIASSDLLDDKTNPIKYQTVCLKCIFRPKRKSESTGQRASSTIRNNCNEASIRLTANPDKTELVIRSICENHIGHDGFEEYRNELPRHRALKSKDVQEEALEYLRMKCPKSQVRKKLINKTGKRVYRKDLDNLNRKLRVKDDDTLEELLKFLLKELGADVSILHSKKEFQGLFFLTKTMLEHMVASPEIVLTDGTYKLFRRKFILQMFTVEDKYGFTQIVGVGVLANETRVTVQWLFETFKNNHGANICDKIQSFMTDKDLIERSVINTVFPGAATLLCKFHTKQTFKREITVRKLDISCKQVDEYLNLVNNMCESVLESQYNKFHKKFMKAAETNDKLLNYFGKNWHCIRTQWTTWGMNKVVNLGNLTNNRLESNHAKIKKHEWMQANDTLTRAMRNLNDWMQYREEHQRAKKVNDIIKTDANPPAGVVGQYKKYLTPFAFKKVEHGLVNFESVEIYESNDISKTCIIKKKGYKIEVSPTNCTCSQWVSSLLICKHILATRQRFNLPLFSEELCTRWSRWKSSNYPNNTKICSNIEFYSAPGIAEMNTRDKESHLDWIIKQLFYTIINGPASKFKPRYELLRNVDSSLVANESELAFEKISKAKVRKILENLVQKLRTKIKKLSPGEFDIKFQELKQIESAWRQNKEFIPRKSTMKLSNELQNLSLNENMTEVSSIILPPQMKILGRQKNDALKCTLPIKKSKYRRMKNV